MPTNVQPIPKQKNTGKSSKSEKKLVISNIKEKQSNCKKIKTEMQSPKAAVTNTKKNVHESKQSYKAKQ
jgi:hypothetical protein